MDVSVVISCWNGKELLEKNLPKVLEASENPKNQITEVIVVDDFSSDDSVKYLKDNFSLVKIYEHQKNYGYAKVCNTGIEKAKGELVVILNADVIPENGFLIDCLPLFKDEKTFSVSFNEGNFGPGRLVWKKGFLEIEKNEELPTLTDKTDWPSGGSSIFRKSYWQKLGGMDKIFLPFYFEDIDLGVRAANFGFVCLWEPKSRVIHEHESTINSKSFDQNFIDRVKQRNHLLLTWKNLNSPKRFFSHVNFLVKRCFFHPKYIKILFLALRQKLK